MRTASLLVFVALLLGPVTTAGDPPGIKTDFHVGTNPASDHREGGETIYDALPIASLPFFDDGATCDNLNDYDETCPYGGSQSPDVVYSYVPVQDENVQVDLCFSAYDTKVYIYDSGLNQIACNDDYYSGGPCGTYVSFLEDVALSGGETYYIVVDGYGGDCGEYTLLILACEPPPPCFVPCPDDAEQEGEPPLVGDYVDTYNGGCDSYPPVFQDLVPPPGQTILDFCGKTGWFRTGYAFGRDTDWFRVVANGPEVVWAADSAYIGIHCNVMYLSDCNDVSVLPFNLGFCSGSSVTIPTTPGEILNLKVEPIGDAPPVCYQGEHDYVMQLSGIASVVPVQPETWGALKSLYR